MPTAAEGREGARDTARARGEAGAQLAPQPASGGSRRSLRRFSERGGNYARRREIVRLSSCDPMAPVIEA